MGVFIVAQDSDVRISSQLLTRDELIEKIKQREFLAIAADESVLENLPSGNWVGGTIPYFMTEDGGTISRDMIFVNTIEGVSANNPPRITLYDQESISRIALEAPDHGFTIVILPAMSDVHALYAQNAPSYEQMFYSPIIGWIAGMHLDDLGERSAKVAFGPANGMLVHQQAVAMHIPIPEHQMANVNIVNLFKPGVGSEILFPNTGFKVKDCKIDGETVNFCEYIKEKNIDTRLPLVADYSGVMVNVSIQGLDEASSEVSLYAPVFNDVTYRFAKPVDDYVSDFEKQLPASLSEDVAFSCNCILNFLYSELEGKKTRDITGPITFGEVAYQLVNQTLVYMTLTSNR